MASNVRIPGGSAKFPPGRYGEPIPVSPANLGTREPLNRPSAPVTVKTPIVPVKKAPAPAVAKARTPIVPVKKAPAPAVAKARTPIVPVKKAPAPAIAKARTLAPVSPKRDITTDNKGRRRLFTRVQRKPFTMFPDQEVHLNNIKRAINEGYRYYFDASETGTGKTFTTLQLAKDLDMDIMVIAPKTLGKMWKDLAVRFRVYIVDAITYQSARIKVHRYVAQVRFGQLEIVDNQLRDSSRRGVILVLDECHNIKGDTYQTAAVTRIATAIREANDKNIIAFLSATPFDKRIFTSNFMRIAQIIKTEVIIKSDEGSYVYTNEYNEFYNRCAAINSRLAEKIDAQWGTSPIDMIYELFLEFFYLPVCFVMKLELEVNSETYNVFFPLTEEEDSELKEAVASLGIASARFVYGMKTYLTSRSSGAITIAARDIEYAKRDIFLDAAEFYLKLDPNIKVVIGVSYLVTQAYLVDNLRDYRVEFINGDIDIEGRQESIIAFNQENTNTRVFITTFGTGGAGISLHDTSEGGRFPRILLISPNFRIIDQHQMMGRIRRRGTTSLIRTLFVYGGSPESHMEMRIMNALAIKSENLSDLTRAEEKGFVFPGDLPNYEFAQIEEVENGKKTLDELEPFNINLPSRRSTSSKSARVPSFVDRTIEELPDIVPEENE